MVWDKGEGDALELFISSTECGGEDGGGDGLEMSTSSDTNDTGGCEGVHQYRSCLSKWHHCSASPRVLGTMMTKTRALWTSHQMWSLSSQLSSRMMTKTTTLCISHQMWSSSGTVDPCWSRLARPPETPMPSMTTIGEDDLASWGAAAACTSGLPSFARLGVSWSPPLTRPGAPPLSPSRSGSRNSCTSKSRNHHRASGSRNYHHRASRSGNHCRRVSRSGHRWWRPMVPPPHVLLGNRHCRTRLGGQHRPCIGVGSQKLKPSALGSFYRCSDLVQLNWTTPLNQGFL
jgi:hypothetical protein